MYIELLDTFYICYKAMHCILLAFRMLSTFVGKELNKRVCIVKGNILKEYFSFVDLVTGCSSVR